MLQLFGHAFRCVDVPCEDLREMFIQSPIQECSEEEVISNTQTRNATGIVRSRLNCVPVVCYQKMCLLEKLERLRFVVMGAIVTKRSAIQLLGPCSESYVVA